MAAKASCLHEACRGCRGPLGFREMGRRERGEFSFLAGLEEEVEGGELQEAAFLVKPLTLELSAANKAVEGKGQR